MSRLIGLFDKVITAVITTTSVSAPINVMSAESISVQVVADVDTPSAKTFDTGTMEVQTLTFEALTDTDDGDYVAFYDASGTAWAVAIDANGVAAGNPTGAIWSAIPADHKTNCDTSLAATAALQAAAIELCIDAMTGLSDVITTDDSAADGTMLLTQVVPGPTTNPVPKNSDDSGAGGILGVQTTAGVVTEVSPSANTLTIPAHGLPADLKGQLTTTGTLPAGLSLATDYYVIVVDANTISLSASLSGAAVNITGYGTTAAVHTFTATALAGANVRLQKSNSTKAEVDAGTAVWDDEGSATNITADGDIWLEKANPGFKWARIRYTATAGSITANANTVVKARQ